MVMFVIVGECDGDVCDSEGGVVMFMIVGMCEC